MKVTEEEETGRNKVFDNGQKFPKFDESYEYTHPRHSMNSKKDKLKESTLQLGLVSSGKTKKIMEATREKWLISYKACSIKLTSNV